MLPQLQRHAKKMGRNKEHTAIAVSGCMRLSLRAAEVCRPCDERRLGDPVVAGEGVLCCAPLLPAPAAARRLLPHPAPHGGHPSTCSRCACVTCNPGRLHEFWL